MSQHSVSARVRFLLRAARAPPRASVWPAHYSIAPWMTAFLFEFEAHKGGVGLAGVGILLRWGCTGEASVWPAS